MRKILRGQRIILKHITSDKITSKEYYQIINKNITEILENMTMFFKEPTFKEVYANLNDCEHAWKSKECLSYFIFLNNCLIGVIGADINKKHKSAELWYFLDKDYTGFGYLKEALCLLEKEVFKNNINRIWASVYPHNQKSSNLLLKSNYTFEGLLREDEYNKYFKNYMSNNLYSKIRTDITVF